MANPQKSLSNNQPPLKNLICNTYRSSKTNKKHTKINFILQHKFARNMINFSHVTNSHFHFLYLLIIVTFFFNTVKI
jgi:hypothetical protein